MLPLILAAHPCAAGNAEYFSVSLIGKPQTVRSLNDAGVIIVGSPGAVRERLAAYQELAGFDTVVVKTQFGTLPADMTRANMEAIAREVMPHFQDARAP